MKFIRLATEADIKKGSNKRIVFIDGDETPDIYSFYEALFNALDFPEIFDGDIELLYDMLTNLQWIKHDTIEIVITNFESFLSGESYDDKCDIILLLEDALRSWREDDFDEEDWDMKQLRVHIIGDNNTHKEVTNIFKRVEEEEE